MTVSQPRRQVPESGQPTLRDVARHAQVSPMTVSRALREDGGVSVELHLALEWGAAFGSVGTEVQTRVAEYLGRMADLQPLRVDVVVDEVGPVRA